jgi:hypothetical protein
MNVNMWTISWCSILTMILCFGTTCNNKTKKVQRKLTCIYYGSTNKYKGVLVLSTTLIPMQAPNVGEVTFWFE